VFFGPKRGEDPVSARGPSDLRVVKELRHVKNEKFSRSKKVQSPTYTTAVELLRSVSKWEFVGCRA
jgi:hypothetical protein